MILWRYGCAYCHGPTFMLRLAQFGSREREKEKKINTRGGVKRGCWVLVSRAARA